MKKAWVPVLVLVVLLFGAAVAGVTYYLTSSDGQHSTPTTVGHCVVDTPTSDPLEAALERNRANIADANQDASLCPGSWQQVPRSQVKSP